MVPVVVRPVISHYSFINLCQTNILTIFVVLLLLITTPSIWLVLFVCLLDLPHLPLVRVHLLINDTHNR